MPEQKEHIDNLMGPLYLPRYTRTLQRALGARPFFGGTQPLYADFMVFHVLDMCEALRQGSVASLSPPLYTWMGRVAELPGVREYLAQRAPLESLGIHRQRNK